MIQTLPGANSNGLSFGGSRSSGPSAAPKRGSSLLPEKRQENPSLPNEVSETSLNNNSSVSGISSQSGDFRSTLHGHMDAPSDSGDREPVQLSDSDDAENSAPKQDASTAPAPTAVPIVTAAKAKHHGIVTNDPDGMSHRLAWNSFLHKMKAELHVSANDILKAFRSLTVEELKQPPLKNVQKLVVSLGLNEQQSAVAQQLFRELIQRTDSKPMGEALNSSVNQTPLAMMSQKEAREKSTEHSLAKMNRQFFVKQPPQHPSQTQQTDKNGKRAAGGAWLPAASKMATPSASSVATPKMVTAQTLPQAQPTGKVVHAQMKPQMELQGQQTAPVQKAAIPLVAGMQAAKPGDEIPKEIAAKLPKKPGSTQEAKLARALRQHRAWESALNDQNQVKAPGQNWQPVAPKWNAVKKDIPSPAVPGVQAAPSNVAQMPVTPSPMAAVPPVSRPVYTGTPDKNHDDNGGDDQSSQVDTDNDSAQTVGQQQFAVSNSQHDVSGKQVNAVAGPQTMPVPDLVQQAHVMMKDGGGEMRVVLQPEGLGEVAMKVKVDGNKVNVQMITQSDEAKKLLEHSFQALKDGLNVHHLNLESVKIDTASNLGKQLDQQYQDAQRQQARQFLEQFHQQNEGWRQAFFDIPGADVYRSQTSRKPDGPASIVNQSMSSRRLDLVA